jgi:predicted esterase
MFKRDIQWFCSRFVACAALCAILSVPALAKDSQETVGNGSPDIFIKKLSGSSQQLDPSYKATETTYFLHVPDDYMKDRAYPLVLAISPGNEGDRMFTSWIKAAEKHKFFFACPNKAGNEVGTDIRGQRAVDTLHDARQKYNIDPEQIYVSGFSGGGRMSTGMVTAFPGVFAGQIPMGGIVIGQDINELGKLKVKLGIYLFAGEKCFNKPESERAKEVIEKAGIPVALMIGPGMEHEMANADQGLEIYEWFLTKTEPAVKARFADAQKAEKAGKLGAALKTYEAVAAMGGISECIKAAEAKVTELRDAARKCMTTAKETPTRENIAAVKKLAASYEGHAIGVEAASLATGIENDPRVAEMTKKAENEARAAKARGEFAKAAETEKAGKLLQALEMYEAVLKLYADTPVKDDAQAAVDRLKGDPALVKERDEKEASRELRLAENMLANGMTDKARTILEEILQKHPDTEAAKKAKLKIEKLK